jgi:hypothetical protein
MPAVGISTNFTTRPDRVLAGSLNLRIFELKKFDCLKIVPPLSILARLQALYQYRLHCGYNHVDV